MLKETLSLLRAIENKIPMKCFVFARPHKEGLHIKVSVEIKGRPYDLHRIFSDVEILNFKGDDDILIDHFCRDFNNQISGVKNS